MKHEMIRIEKSKSIKSFCIGKYPITQELYESVMGNNPSYFSGHKNRPVENVSWYDAIEFCNKLSLLEGFTPAYKIDKMYKISKSKNTVTIIEKSTGYRLPTEAQWVYAYGEPENLLDHAWLNAKKTQKVGKKLPNKHDLYDMVGNVWEWCWDSTPSGYYRVIRGGSWYYNAENVRVELRSSYDPDFRLYSNGFRVALP